MKPHCWGELSKELDDDYLTIWSRVIKHMQMLKIKVYEQKNKRFPIHLKYKGYSNNSHEETVLSYSSEDIHFIWFPSIELVEYL